MKARRLISKGVLWAWFKILREKRIGNDSNLSYQLADISNLIVTKYTVFHKLHLGIQVFLTEVLNMLKLTQLFISDSKLFQSFISLKKKVVNAWLDTRGTLKFSELPLVLYPWNSDTLWKWSNKYEGEVPLNILNTWLSLSWLCFRHWELQHYSVPNAQHENEGQLFLKTRTTLFWEIWSFFFKVLVKPAYQDEHE